MTIEKEAFPKTARYRGKTYARVDVFTTKKSAEAVAKRNGGTNEVGTFFTYVKKFVTYKGNKYYVLYWRAVYKKKPLRSRLSAIRSKKVSAKDMFYR